MRERRPLDGLDHVVDVHLDLRPLGVAAEDAAHAAGAEDLRRLERPRRPGTRACPAARLNDFELGQTDPCASCSLIPSRSACSRICRTAASSSSTAGGSEIIAHVSLIERQVVEELGGRELVAADAAVDRAELDAGGLPRRQPRCVQRGRRGSEYERASIHAVSYPFGAT